LFINTAAFQGSHIDVQSSIQCRRGMAPPYLSTLMTNCIVRFWLAPSRWPWMTLDCYKFKFSRNFALLVLLRIFG